MSPTPKVGCQTYTWEMLGSRWTGSTDDILNAIAGAGYAGIEITGAMIGPYADDARAFGEALRTRGLELVAFGWSRPSGFTVPEAVPADLEAAERAMRFVGAFPGAVFSIGSATATREGGDTDAMIDVAADFYNRAGEIGRRTGVPVAFHASSHHGTVLVTRAQYDRVMRLTDPALVGWVPDTGHIVRGGQDLLGTLRDHASRIRYVHLKDAGADGSWRMMGRGVCDMPAVVACLRDELGFDGWLVLEEESPEAGRDPARAVRLNREYMATILG